MTTKLSVKEAIEQGYTLCGYDNEDFQNLMHIDKLVKDDWNRYDDAKIVLADTANPTTYGITGEEIADLITDKIAGQDDINDEDDAMIGYLDEYKELSADLDVIAEKINSYIGKHKVYWLTDIELIP